MIKVNEYSFPKVYEAEYGKITYDFDIFCNTLLKGTALDIACGTGRITTQLAKIGLICTGIDSNSSMLSIAIDKAKNLNLDIDYLNLDMRDFSLGKKFDLITIAGNSFQALLNELDQRNFLKCVSQHLTDDGLFIISTRNSTEKEMYTSSEFEYWHNFIDECGKNVSVYGMQIFDPKIETVKYFTKRIWEDHQTLSEIELKFTTYDKLYQLLKESGLKSIEVYGGFNKERFDHATSTDIIMICTRDLSKAISEAQSLIKDRFSQDDLMNDLKSMRQKDY